VQPIDDDADPLLGLYKMLGSLYDPKTDTVMAPSANDVSDYEHHDELTKKQAVTQLEGALPPCRCDATNPESNVTFHTIGVDFVAWSYLYCDKSKKTTNWNDAATHIAVFLCAKT